MQVSNINYDPEEMMRQLTPDALLLQQRLQHVVDKAVLAAAQHIMLAAGDKNMMQKDWQVPTRVQNSIEKSVRQALRDGLRLMPTSHDSVLPYQDSIPQQIHSDIETEKLHLIAYCNSQLNCKHVSWDYIDSGILNECNIPACSLYPLDVRKFNARINNDVVYSMRGELARYIKWFDLWNAVSPWDNQNQRHVRFSLPTAIMVLRLSGMKHITDTEDFLHFDHPQNNISCNVENRLNESGHAFLIAKKLAEAWNAMVSRKHNHPPLGSEAYELMQRDFFTMDDVEQTLGVLSKLIRTQPDTFKKQSELFFALRKTKTKVQHADAERLFQPVITLQDDAQIREAGKLYDSYEAGEWTNTGIITKDPISCPRSGRNQPTVMVHNTLANVRDFNWDRAKDCFMFDEHKSAQAQYNSSYKNRTLNQGYASDKQRFKTNKTHRRVGNWGK
jgi:hypothetical protein